MSAAQASTMEADEQALDEGEQQRSSVYLVPHATEPRFKLGKANDVISRLRQVSKSNGSYELDWDRGLRLECSDEAEAIMVESLLRNIPWVKKTRYSHNDRGDGHTEWHHIDVFDPLREFIAKNATDLRFEIKYDLRQQVSQREEQRKREEQLTAEKRAANSNASQQRKTVMPSEDEVEMVQAVYSEAIGLLRLFFETCKLDGVASVWRSDHSFFGEAYSAGFICDMNLGDPLGKKLEDLFIAARLDLFYSFSRLQIQGLRPLALVGIDYMRVWPSSFRDSIREAARSGLQPQWAGLLCEYARQTSPSEAAFIKEMTRLAHVGLSKEAHARRDELIQKFLIDAAHERQPVPTYDR